SANDALCFGANGSLSFSATGGSGTITFTVNGDTTTSPYTAVAGTYTIVATDANSCSVSAVRTISEPATAVDLSASANDALCFGANGSLSFSATGGSGTITFTVNGDTTTSPYTAVAGTYTIVATDANSCSVSAIRTISEPATAVDLSASSNNALCFGGNGSLSFSATGGSGVISYTVNGTAATSPFTATTGTYTIVATDANSCSVSAIRTISAPIAGINLSASANNASCFGGNGSLSYSASGGTGTIAYTVNATSASSPYTAVAGTYTIVATDANSCSVSAVRTISEPSALVLSASATDASCASGNGSLTFSASGGTGIVIYTVNATTQTSPYSAAAGTYTIVATDANNCSSSTVATVTQPTPLNNGCTMPSNVSVSNITYNAVNVNFTKSGTAQTTQVQIRVKGTPTWGTIATATGVANITGLTQLTTYEYRLRSACSNKLFSDYTCIQEFTTPIMPPPCLAPSDVNGVALCGTQFRINWTAANNASSYTLQFKQSANAGWSTNVMTRALNAATTSYTFITAWPGTWYTYRIRTNCAPGTLTPNSTWSAEGNLLTPGVRPPNATLSNEINDFNADWVFYPNPSNGLVNVSYTSYADDDITLLVMDMTGRILQQIKTQAVLGENHTQINLAELPSGIYTIKAIQQGESKMVGKLTKE
ncbi:MAG: T9SS type A sorting domain-containing protein, partial [Chitinophagaceae bacterium]|nr:T9SS type A sorting domain-containing protein [Chitinophagaceae bacterium]